MYTSFGEVLLIIPYLGYGDILYHTPLIRILSKIYNGVDVWAFNPEPLYNNPYVKNIFHLSNDNTLLDPWDFYFEKVYMTGVNNLRLTEYYPSNFYTPEYFTAATIHSCLTDNEKHLTYVSKSSSKVEEYFKKIKSIASGGIITAINPSIGWPSRTLPLGHYKELIRYITAIGDSVVLIGKDISPDNLTKGIISEVKNNEKKGLYPVEELKGERVFDLTNQLSFDECAKMYSLVDIAVNTENGNMVISSCNDNCWNLYIPMLTAPEFRIPYRKASQRYRTYVVGNDDKYYPGSDYAQLRKGFNYITADSHIPSVEKIFQAYLKVRQLKYKGKDYAD